MERERVGMQRKRRRVVVMSVVALLILLALGLWSPLGWGDASSDRSQVESEEPVERVGVVAEDRTPEGRSAAADPVSRRLWAADKGNGITLRWSTHRQLATDRSLQYGTEPLFADTPFSYDQLDQILASPRGGRAVEGVRGLYSLPLPSRKWYLWLEDEFGYLIGSNSVSKEELRQAPTVRWVQAGASCRGRVVDAVGRPLSGVFVCAMVIVSEASDLMSRLGGLRVRCTKTDDRGEFVLRALPADTSHKIVFGGRGFVPERANMPPTPAWSSYRMPDTVLSTGGTLEVEVVTRGDRSPIDGAFISARPGPGVVWMDPSTLTARTDADGRAVLSNMAMGSYEVTIQASRMAVRSGTIRLMQKTGNRMLFEMDPGRQLRGTVVADRDGEPLAGASVRANFDGRSYPPWPQKDLRTDAEGRFLIDSLPLDSQAKGHRSRAGKRRLTVYAQGYLSSVQELDPSLPNIEVRLQREVSIYVQPQLPGGKAPETYLLAIHRVGHLPIPLNVQQFGSRYEVEALLPDEILSVTVDAPGSFGQVQAIRVEPGMVVSVPLRAKQILRGYVVGKNGQGLADVDVQLNDPAKRIMRWAAEYGVFAKKRWVQTGGDGRFSIRLAPGESHSLRFSRDGYETVLRSVLARPGAEMTVELEMLPRITGRVLDAGGRAVADAQIYVVSKAPFPSHWTTTNAEGRFRLSLPRSPESSTLRITGSRRAGATWSLLLETKSVEGLILHKPRTPSYARGIVRGLRPTGEARLLATLMDGPTRKKDLTRARTSTPISPDGRFALSNLMPGSYSLEVIKNGRALCRTQLTLPATGVSGIVLEVQDR